MNLVNISLIAKCAAWLMNSALIVFASFSIAKIGFDFVNVFILLLAFMQSVFAYENKRKIFNLIAVEFF